MGNMMVINANYDVKTALTQDIKNSLTSVSNDCEIRVWRAYEGCFEMPIFKLYTRMQVKENRDNTRKRFLSLPHARFFCKIFIKKQEIVKQKVETFHWNLTLRMQSNQFDVNVNSVTVSDKSSHVENGYQQKRT